MTAARGIALAILVTACDSGGQVAPTEPPWSGTELEELPPPPGAGACTGTTVALVSTTPYSSLVDAAVAMATGRTLWLCPGYHEGPLELAAWNGVRVAGITGDPADVWIDGANGAEFLLTDDPTARLAVENITAVDFDSPYNNSFIRLNEGRVLRVANIVSMGCDSASRLIYTRDVEKVVLTDVEVDGGGQRLFFGDVNPWVPSATFTLQDVYIHGMVSGQGAIDFESGGWHANNPQVHIDLIDLVLEDNDWWLPGPVNARGGDIYMTIDGARVERNVTNSGGIFDLESDMLMPGYEAIGRYLITNSTFADNVSTMGDAVIALNHPTSSTPRDYFVDIRDSTFYNNQSAAGHAALAPPGSGALRVTNVDFGAGPTLTNPPHDIAYTTCGVVDFGLVPFLWYESWRTFSGTWYMQPTCTY